MLFFVLSELCVSARTDLQVIGMKELRQKTYGAFSKGRIGPSGSANLKGIDHP
jgi:hypothetical protein